MIRLLLKERSDLGLYYCLRRSEYLWYTCMIAQHFEKLNKSIWAPLLESLTLLYANNKGADQPVHPRSLISTFVIHYLESIVVQLTS